MEIETQSAVLSVVIPAYNEEDGIEAIVERVLSVRPALAEAGISDLELIVVDDGSADRTAEVAERSGVRVVRHPANKGYGAALKTGFSAARGDLLAFLDADGTYPPECFPDLCREALAGADLVVGSRRSGAASEMPLVRRVGNLLWSNLVTLLGNHRVIDPASGMRVFRREALERLYPLPDGLNFTPVMSTRAVHEHVRLVEVPIPYKERVGRSKLSVVHDGMRFLHSIVWTVLSYNPAQVLGIVGLAAVLFSVLIAAGLVWVRLRGAITLGPWGVFSLFTGMVLGVLGVNSFALGAIFNYLVSLFHKRPIRRGVFDKVFLPSLDRQFIWLGILAVLTGLVLAGVKLYQSLHGWPMVHLWIYLVASAMLVLVGIQLDVFWLIARVLEELNQREAMVRFDMECQ